MTALDEDPAAEESIEALIDRIQPKLKQVVARYRLPLEDAEDVLQQSFLDLIYKRRTIQNPEAWLTATVRNRSIIYWRRRRSMPYDAVDVATLEAVAKPATPSQGRAVLRWDLQRALERLTPRNRSLLRLRYGFGYKPQEVAERLGYQTSSIRKVTSRCLARLGRQLQAIGFGNR
jgi:RNA polymerase sigma factor (sigma-70 family)